MPDEFLIRAGLAGIGVALAAGPLGCFVVWRRMAYFGDATAHAALLGVALGLALSVPMVAAVMVAALLMGAAIGVLGERAQATDTLLGVFAHGALALGLVAASTMPTVRTDLLGFLFGDILAVGWSDLAVIWAGAAVVLGMVVWRWSALLTATLSPELAIAGGIDPRREQLFLTATLALVVAVALKVVGALLITAMLIIPAAAARPLARTPETMAVLAAGFGALAALAGLVLSWHLDTPTGPTIVSVAAAMFAATGIVSPLVRR